MVLAKSSTAEYADYLGLGKLADKLPKIKKAGNTQVDYDLTMERNSVVELMRAHADYRTPPTARPTMCRLRQATPRTIGKGQEGLLLALLELVDAGEIG